MILSLYILKNHIAPFAFSVITLIFILLLQFLMKYADMLVGKGLDTWVIIQLIVFNLSWMVVLVVPMASLVATLMAFGNLSQNNEVTIMKSSGISLYKMMAAPVLASVVLAYLLLIFNDDILPDANHQAKILMQDISRKKPTLSLVPGFFSQEVNNYAILVREIDEKSNDLFDVTIYDYSNPAKVNVVTAKKGKLYFSSDQTKLIMDLKEGEIHESESQKTNLYRKLEFTHHRIVMDAEQFSFQQSGPGSPRGERELSISAMNYIIDSLKSRNFTNYPELNGDVKKYFFVDTATTNKTYRGGSFSNKQLVYTRAIDRVKEVKNIVLAHFKRIEWVNREIEKYDVEVYKKYALPAACIVFVLIGAPLGVMVRKGGFGVAAGISLFFFLIYWAFLIGGEKLSERDFFSPFWGMWAANILIGIAGIILTIRTNLETVNINFDFIKRLIPQKWQKNLQSSNHENS